MFYSEAYKITLSILDFILYFILSGKSNNRKLYQLENSID